MVSPNPLPIGTLFGLVIIFCCFKNSRKSKSRSPEYNSYPSISSYIAGRKIDNGAACSRRFPALPKTNSLPLKHCGWETIFIVGFYLFFTAEFLVTGWASHQKEHRTFAHHTKQRRFWWAILKLPNSFENRKPLNSFVHLPSFLPLLYRMAGKVNNLCSFRHNGPGQYSDCVQYFHFKMAKLTWPGRFKSIPDWRHVSETLLQSRFAASRHVKPGNSGREK